MCSDASSNHVDDLLLKTDTPRLELLNRLQKQFVAVPLSCALNREDEVITHPAQLDLALEFGVAQALTTDCIPHGVLDYGLLLALVTLVSAAGNGGLLLCDLFEANDALGEALSKLVRVLAKDWPRDGDGRHEAVGGGGDGGEFGVIGADALVHVHVELDALAGPQLGDEDVGVDGADGVLAGEELDLAAGRNELNVLCVDARVVEGLCRVRLAGGGVRVAGALDAQAQLDGVVVEGALAALLGLAIPLQELVQALGVSGEGNEAEAVGEDLVLDHRGIVLNVDVLDGDGGDLGDEGTAEGVCNGGVDADEGEGGFVLGIVVELDAEVGGETVEVPGVVLAGVGARVVGRSHIGDSFLVDTDYL